MSISRNLAILAVCCASTLTVATAARADLTHSTCIDADPLVRPHNIIVFANAYFPRELFVKSGDLIKFHNKTGFKMTIVTTAGPNIVTSLDNGRCQVVTFSGNTEITLNKPNLTNASNNSGKQGFIRVGAAPNQ